MAQWLMNLTRSHDCSGLRIRHCHELWCRSQTQLGSGIAVTLVQASGYSSKRLEPQPGNLHMSWVQLQEKDKKKKKRKKEFLSSETIWMKLQCAVLSKINQTRKDKYCMISLTCRTNKHTNKPKLTDTENRRWMPEIGVGIGVRVR